MALLDVIGDAFGLTDAKGWRLEGLDSSFASLIFQGDFIAEGMQEEVGSNLGELEALNKETPDVNWLSGSLEPFSFTSRIFADDSLKNVKKKIELLKSVARRDATLKRAPKFTFTAGTEIGFTCFVRKVRFLYDELRDDGSLRGAIINLTLQKLEETVTENAATSLSSQIKAAAGVVAGVAGIAAQLDRVIDIPFFSPVTLDKIVVAKAGDTFESIAQAEYGNALFGDILRRVQPDKADLQVGDEVQLVERTQVGLIPVTQQSTPLKNTPLVNELKATFFELRNRKANIIL